MWRNGPLGAIANASVARDTRPRSGRPGVDGEDEESYQKSCRMAAVAMRGEGPMRFRLPHIFLTLAATVCALAAPAAHAFTVENKDEAGQYGVPKFDLEEQAKNFRKGGSDVSSTGKSDLSTPLGNGTLHFGVTQGPASFGSMFGPGLGCRDRRGTRVRSSTAGSRHPPRWNTTTFAERLLRPPSPSRAV